MKNVSRLTSHVLCLTCFCLLITGCGKSVTGSNAELDVAHTGGPDCTQSGCHPRFGAGGTVFESAASTTPASGITVKAKSSDTGEIVLGISDSLGNFHYDSDLKGYFNMSVRSGIWSNLHTLPDMKGCNSCHTWPSPSVEISGRLSIR